MDLPTQELGGQALVQQVVSLTGLPEQLLHQEVDEILTLAGSDAAKVTLDELRAAMLAYLEEMNASFELQHQNE